MKPTLPLKEGHTYKDSNGKIGTMEHRSDDSVRCKETCLYYDRNSLTAPGTDVTIVEEIVLDNEKNLTKLRKERDTRLKRLRELEDTKPC